jgi:hypothetical protein
LERNQQAKTLAFIDEASAASTGCGVATSKITKADDAQLTAVTSALPSCADSSNGCQPSETFICDIVDFGHDGLSGRLLRQVARLGVGSTNLAAHYSLDSKRRLVI